jgi:protein-L-isoaspartate(D-aspartate) O-methyltransferase
MNYIRQRQLMVENQLQAKGIRNERVLKAMGKVPRHMFVDEALAASAYGDYPLPIGERQTISQPYMVALMSEKANLSGGERVLEIGTGSGYQTAILAELATVVYSIELIPALAQRTKELLEQLGYTNIHIRVGDGSLGWPEAAPFDAILVTAGAPDMPEPLIQQLAEGGSLVIPVGSESSQELQIVRKREHKLIKTSCCACAFVKLQGVFGW